jgi:hypothetical protein
MSHGMVLGNSLEFIGVLLNELVEPDAFFVAFTSEWNFLGHKTVSA